MKILFDDFMQYSDAPDSLKSPALAEVTNFQTISINLDTTRTFDCFGIGNVDAPSIVINGQSITLSGERKGLYMLNTPITAQLIIITFPSNTDVGRIALGLTRNLGCAPAREPGFWTTAVGRITLSGQPIPGIGGITGRSLSVDFRYKFDRDIFADVERAYPTQIGRNYPLFLYFDNSTEQGRFPWIRFYGYLEKPELFFQSSVNKFLYSIKMKFNEAF